MSTRPVPLQRALAWLALAALLLVSLAPLAVVVRTALLPAQALMSEGVGGAAGFTLLNLQRVLGLASQEQSLALGASGAEIDFLRALLNSLIYTTLVVVGQTLFAAMAAYAFARLRFVGRDVLFAAFVASMMIPGVVTLIPNFVLMKELGLLNTMAGMIAPFALMQGFAVFFLRQFFLSIPRDLEEAALLEGASPLRIFWRIVLPLSTAPLATLAMLTGINAWNEFFWPFLVAKDETMHTLPVALQAFRAQTPQGQPDWTGLMAGATLTLLPTVLLLLVLGRRVVESVQFSGSK